MDGDDGGEDDDDLDDPSREGMVGAAWVSDKFARLEQKLSGVVARAEAAEAKNERLSEETRKLQAALDAQMRLSDEKLNQEIRERAELQLQVRLAERDVSQEKSSLETLSEQVHQLQQVLQMTRQTQDEIVSSVQIAERADGNAHALRLELEQAKEATRQAEDELREKGGRLEEAVSRVRSELLANAEQVGAELRQRVKEIQTVEAQERTDATAASEAANALAERLAELSNELRNAESIMQEEVAERKAAEADAAAEREEMKNALIAAQEAARAEAQEEISNLKSELDVRKRAEEALQVMLAAAHEQQGQLEDVGNQHQGARAGGPTTEKHSTPFRNKKGLPSCATSLSGTYARARTRTLSPPSLLSLSSPPSLPSLFSLPHALPSSSLSSSPPQPPISRPSRTFAAPSGRRTSGWTARRGHASRRSPRRHGSLRRRPLIARPPCRRR